MRKTWMRFAVLAAIMSLAATACAKSANTGASSSPSGTPSSSGGVVSLSGKVNNKGSKDLTAQGMTIKLDLEADSFYFNPTFLKAAPGAKVTLELENESAKKHNFTIESLHVDQDLAPGKKADVTFTLPTSGVVNFFCEYHHQLGMQGAFFFSGTAPAVQTAASSSSAGSGYGY